MYLIYLIYLYSYVPIYLFIYLSIYLSICLSIYLSISGEVISLNFNTWRTIITTLRRAYNYTNRNQLIIIFSRPGIAEAGGSQRFVPGLLGAFVVTWKNHEQSIYGEHQEFQRSFLAKVVALQLSLAILISAGENRSIVCQNSESPAAKNGRG